MKRLSQYYYYLGCDDDDLDLFEGQYPIPHGISYNSYLLKDGETALFDTVDVRKGEEWLANLKSALDGDKLDYLIVSHLEPDHSSEIGRIISLYPEAKLVMSECAKRMLKGFIGNLDLDDRIIEVKEGATLNIGEHTIQFHMAPFVHWPEVMMEFDAKEGILFSADGFGKFGSLSFEETWINEARRYYYNIVGKYGPQVQAALKKLSPLPIKKIYPLHGPMLESDLGYYLGLYNQWSTYQSEYKGTLILAASMYGFTYRAAEELEKILKEKGEETHLLLLNQNSMSEAVGLCFAYPKIVLACPTYDGGIFSPMKDLLHRLKAKNFSCRAIGILENGSWAPVAGKLIKSELAQFKDITIIEPMVTIHTSYMDKDKEKMEELSLSLVNYGK